MIKTLIKQLILEECINEFFDKISYNFTPLNEHLTLVCKKDRDYNYFNTIYATINNNGKIYNLKKPTLWSQESSSIDIESMKSRMIKYAAYDKMSLYKYLITREEFTKC